MSTRHLVEEAPLTREVKYSLGYPWTKQRSKEIALTSGASSYTREGLLLLGEYVSNFFYSKLCSRSENNNKSNNNQIVIDH